MRARLPSKRSRGTCKRGATPLSPGVSSLAQHWPIALIALVAGLARGFSGFGAALIFVPLAGALVTPAVSAPVLLIVDNVMALGLLPNAFRRAALPAVFVMAAGSLAGAPLGTYALAHLSTLTLRWGIAGLALAMLALLISGWRYGGAPHRWITVAAGVFAGFCSGVAQIGGPLVAAYWLGGASSAPSARASIIAYFAISSVVTTVTYAVGGLLTRDVFALSLLCAPAYGVGIGLGALGHSAADDPMYRRVSYGLIALAAVLSLPLWQARGA